VSDNNCVRFTQEAQQTGFSEFLDVVKNIMSAGGWWTQVTLRTQWDQLFAKGATTWLPNHTTRQRRPSNNGHG